MVVSNAGVHGLKKVRIMDNMYIYISTDNIVELIRTSCPPNHPVSDSRCYKVDDCLECWWKWLKGGEINA